MQTRVCALVAGAEGSALSSLGPTAVFSVHLDATHEDQRVAQLAKCLQQARQLGTREVIVAGDMNTEILPVLSAPSSAAVSGCVSAQLRCQSVSAVYRLVQRGRRHGAQVGLLAQGSAVENLVASAGGAAEPEGGAVAPEEVEAEAALRKECASALRLEAGEPPSEAQIADWRQLRADAAAAVAESRIRLARVPTHGTRAAYDHGCTAGPCVSWRLDHILYTPRTLRCATHWQTLEADPEAEAAGLPNRRCPSDHLPVGCSFEVGSAPRLGESVQAALRASCASPLPCFYRGCTVRRCLWG